ncbi:unnamed protein product [Polarella glacialis]|uniref:Centrosomal protein of 44 kDa n=2 Tax=Polarella glacialis TaxID=89957 RepID=A0A813HAK4_POLGL|nr:unnamed protein product [Polarella glacialis]
MVGDVDANVERLRAQLRQMRFPAQELDLQGLRAGRPAALLPVMHFAMLDFSAPFAHFLRGCGQELRSKSDLRFLESVYKVLREYLNYSPVLTVSQFFAPGFAERKVLLCLDVLQAVLAKHEDLLAQRAKAGSSKGSIRPKQRGELLKRSTFRESDIVASEDRSEMVSVETYLEATVLEPRREGFDFDGSELSWNEPWEAPDQERDLPLPQEAPEPFRLDAPARHPDVLQFTDLAKESTSSAVSEEADDAAPKGSKKLGSHMTSFGKKPAAAAARHSNWLPNERADPLEALLEEIRSALELRFESLERRFEHHVEAASARATLLEGEVRILSARLNELQVAAPRVTTEARPPVIPGVGETNSPEHPTVFMRHELGWPESLPLPGRAPATASRSMASDARVADNVIAEALAASSVSSFSADLVARPVLPPQLATTFGFEQKMGGTEVLQQRKPSDSTRGFVENGQADEKRGFTLEPDLSLLPAAGRSGASLSDPLGGDSSEARALIEKLTAKFRDTQELLYRAREKIGKADLGNLSSHSTASEVSLGSLGF